MGRSLFKDIANAPEPHRTRYLKEYAAMGSQLAKSVLEYDEQRRNQKRPPAPSVTRRAPRATAAEDARVEALCRAATARLLDPYYDPDERTPSGYEYECDDEVPEGTVLN